MPQARAISPSAPASLVAKLGRVSTRSSRSHRLSFQNLNCRMEEKVGTAAAPALHPRPSQDPLPRPRSEPSVPGAAPSPSKPSASTSLFYSTVTKGQSRRCAPDYNYHIHIPLLPLWVTLGRPCQRAGQGWKDRPAHTGSQSVWILGREGKGPQAGAPGWRGRRGHGPEPVPRAGEGVGRCWPQPEAVERSRTQSAGQGSGFSGRASQAFPLSLM